MLCQNGVYTYKKVVGLNNKNVGKYTQMMDSWGKKFTLTTITV